MPSQQKGIRMSSMEVSFHAEERMLERGISFGDLAEGLLTGKQQPSRFGIAFVSKQMTVVVDRLKKTVITAWWN
jgi:hypothetical protein